MNTNTWAWYPQRSGLVWRCYDFLYGKLLRIFRTVDKPADNAELGQTQLSEKVKRAIQSDADSTEEKLSFKGLRAGWQTRRGHLNLPPQTAGRQHAATTALQENIRPELNRSRKNVSTMGKSQLLHRGEQAETELQGTAGASPAIQSRHTQPRALGSHKAAGRAESSGEMSPQRGEGRPARREGKARLISGVRPCSPHPQAPAVPPEPGEPPLASRCPPGRGRPALPGSAPPPSPAQPHRSPRSQDSRCAAASSRLCRDFLSGPCGRFRSAKPAMLTPRRAGPARAWQRLRPSRPRQPGPCSPARAP